MRLRPCVLLLLACLAALAPVRPAGADDWQVKRSEFDPRIVGSLLAELRRHPEDANLLRRLMGLYRRNSSLDKLGAELKAQADKSGSGADYLLAALFERERGRLDVASQLVRKAKERPAGPDAVKAALLLADLAVRHAPPDIQTARRSLEEALPALPSGDARRRKILRRLVDLYTQAGEQVLAAQSLTELLSGAQGQEALGIYRERAAALTRAGKAAEALADWRKVSAGGGKVESRAEAELRIGELCETLHQDLEAIAAYRRGLGILPAQHYLRRELYEHLIALHRKRDELPELLARLEKEWPPATRSFADWELLARLYDERGDTASATFAYRAALRREPHNIDVRRRLISIAERSGVTSDVLREYEQLIAQAPGDSRAYLELAERLDKSGQRQKALAWLRRAAVRFAGDPSLHSALSDIYQRWGEADLALAEAELLARLDPRDESYIINLGEMYFSRGRKEKADEVWRRLLNVAPSRPIGQARLADVYAEHNLMAQALDLYLKAVHAEPNNLQLRRGLALCSERLNRQAEAVRHWEQIYFSARASSDRPLRLEARQHLGKILRRETRLLPSLYSWERRLQAQLNGMAQDKLEPAELLALGLLVADLSLVQGRTADAEKILVQLQIRLQKENGPLLAEVLLALVSVYQQEHKLEEAISALKQAAALLPDRRRELYAQLADLSLQSYHDEDAVHYAQQAVVDAQGELRLGEIFERRDDNNAAMSAYRRAIELDGRLFRAHMALARLHLGRGELKEAAAIYRDVVRQAPQEELVLEAGRKAIDLHEFLNSLDDFLREITPLGYASVPKPVYRKLLLLVYERHAAPLFALARAGDAKAQAELLRLGQSSFKPLAETLADGELAEQRLAVTLLAAMSTPGAASALLNFVSGNEAKAAPASAKNNRRTEAPAGSEPELGNSNSGRGLDIDLRVDALLAAARLEDPRSAAAFFELANSREKQIRLGALYGLLRLCGRPAGLPSAAFATAATGLFEKALSDQRPAVKALAYLGLGTLAASGRGLAPRLRTQISALFERRRVQPEDVDDLVVAAAVHALGLGRERATVPQLIELLGQGNDEVQRQAAWALGAIGDARAVGPLLRAVFVKNEPIRQTAAAALRQITASSEPDSARAKNALRLPLEHRALDGLDVGRWLADCAVFSTFPDKLPQWVSAKETSPLLAALEESALSHQDIALRMLSDLLGEAGTLPFALGPLTPQIARETPGPAQAFFIKLAQGFLPTLRRLARGEPPGGSAAESAPAMDQAVREHALLLLGRFLNSSDASLKKSARATLLEVARSNAAPALLLSAVGVLAEHATAPFEMDSAELTNPPLDRLLDRTLLGRQRLIRLAAIEIAAKPGGAAFVSPTALRKASEDSDGFVRESAAKLLNRRP